MRFSHIVLATATLSLHQAAAFTASFQQRSRIAAFAPRSRSSSSSLAAAASPPNVILRPTTEDDERQPQASSSDDVDNDAAATLLTTDRVFDSLSIGGCHVHRYKSTSFNTDDTGVNYVMWYHGRSIEQDREESLPPLSTGRIGRATSKNGLVFEKDTAGSSAEDITGVALGLNQESWWGFDTAHVGLGSVLLPMTTPAVMTEGGIYLMYYFGGSFQETKINDYTTADMPDDLTIQGMNMRIGVAVSQDGETWGRVEGDDPTGACMAPYDKSDPNTADMAEMKDDDNKSDLDLVEELYCGWPEVVVRIDDKNEANSGFFMYYSTMTKDDKQKCLGVAVSADGFRWYKRGLCLTPSDDPGALDHGGVARCSVTRNAVFSDLDGTWADAPGYTMLYEGVSGTDNKHRILRATSPDGRVWTKEGVVLDLGNDWDCDGVGSPNILRMDDGSQRMYYVGQKGKDTAIGVARMEFGADTFVREQTSFVFAEA
mmetsp:Transcript_9056/g.20730  ORF Transcript_9056/g.20730 Transcript_9056/m.20730 type:complete len:486 (-) Transcript_9056:609-2066(-)|eukprot:CAMPEP_0201122236 /NCGR_PEP_ID=MMETSP0850-20130426/5923_1 /ASSEMBLY_ACC=CAM_ASM_000622 /TAXON_ID=183588 /ORGANISM="Pseudo-nitzschia fraudulenta, Strain WWA7" /LENGTH=485 /DNA_ID=CAMNT_0047388883 /DNA_START=270 /DNA_END=1727 /DNA_ORIENTATION=+